jgi:hypothetical protein
MPKILRYSAASVITTLVSLGLLAVLLLATTPGWANLVAVAVGSVMSFELNRRWVWQQSNRKGRWMQLLLFICASLVFLGMSTLAVREGEFGIGPTFRFDLARAGCRDNHGGRVRRAVGHAIPVLSSHALPDTPSGGARTHLIRAALATNHLRRPAILRRHTLSCRGVTIKFPAIDKLRISVTLGSSELPFSNYLPLKNLGWVLAVLTRIGDDGLDP